MKTLRDTRQPSFVYNPRIYYEVSILRTFLLILLSVVAIGCDDMRKPAMDVISDPVATEITQSPVTTDPEYLSLTLENLTHPDRKFEYE